MSSRQVHFPPEATNNNLLEGLEANNKKSVKFNISKSHSNQTPYSPTIVEDVDDEDADDEVDLDGDSRHADMSRSKGSAHHKNGMSNGSTHRSPSSLAYQKQQDSLEDDDESPDNRPLMGGGGGNRRKGSGNHFSIGTIRIYKPPKRRLDRCCRQWAGTIIALIITASLLVFMWVANRRFKLVSQITAQYGGFGGGAAYRSSSSVVDSLTWDGHPLHGSPMHVCDRLDIRPVWNVTFPRLTIESAFRAVDVNNDSVDDVILGFGTGADAASYPDVVCAIYFNDSDTTYGCGGGLMALDGRDGSLLWSRLTRHELFALNCGMDLTGDGIRDCVAGGRMASLYAVDSATGDIIWGLLPDHEAVADVSNFYTPLYIPKDLDGDGTPDLVVMHGGDPLRRAGARIERVARLILVSARKGTILSYAPVPDNRESYYSPQLLTQNDGTSLVLFGTGGETHGGSLFVVSLEDLIHRRMSRARALYTDCCKGVMVPPALVDINGDSVVDIVMSLFNGTVVAFNGVTFARIWSHPFPGAESYSTPAVGRFNADTIPDFMVIYQEGPGFPIYHRTVVDVLDGRDGKSLLTKPIAMQIGTQSSPLSVTTSSTTDHFLFWFVTCDDNSTTTTPNSATDTGFQPFQVAPDATVHQTSRADFCRLRFNRTFFSQMRSLSAATKVQTVLYDSRAARRTEYPHIDYSHLGEDFFRAHEDRLGKPVIDEDYEANLRDAATLLQEAMEREALMAAAASGPAVGRGQQDYQDTNGLWQQISSMARPQIDAPTGPFLSRSRRVRRHVGAHDGEGIQRTISTGTLVDALNGKGAKGSIDYVFGTYWFPPEEGVKLMSPAMRDCWTRYSAPEKEAAMRLTDPTSQYYNIDHDAYRDLIKDLCAAETGEQSRSNADQGSSGDAYDPFNRPMGAMTVYRYGLSCAAPSQKSGTTPASSKFWRWASSDAPTPRQGVLRPYRKQIWPAYMGKEGNGLANVN